MLFCNAIPPLHTLLHHSSTPQLFNHRDNIMPKIKDALNRLNNDHIGIGCSQVVFKVLKCYAVCNVCNFASHRGVRGLQSA